MRAALPLLLLLASCGSGEVKESDPATIRNQAESLERAANATTDQLIRQIEDDAKAEEAAKESETAAPVTSAENANQ